MYWTLASFSLAAALSTVSALSFCCLTWFQHLRLTTATVWIKAGLQWYSLYLFSRFFVSFFFFFGAYISVPTPEPLMPLSPQHIPVVAIGIICTISRHCSEKCHTVFVRALHLSIFQQKTDLRVVGISTKEHIVNGGLIFFILTSKVSAAYSFSLLSEYIEIK